MKTCDINDSCEARTISLLSDRPFYVRDENTDEVIVYWYGYAMTYRLFALYMSEIFFEVFVSKSARSAAIKDYIKKHSTGVFDNRHTQYWQYVNNKSSNGNATLEYGMFRAYFFTHCISQNLRELVNKYDNHDVILWLDVNHMLGEQDG